MLPGLGRRGNGELLLKGYKVSVWGDEKVLEILVMVTQSCEAHQCHWIVYFNIVKMAIFMTYILPQ